ncbi:uncharacterized protein N7511_005521, partial [Penicillium nucicola]|uniref:uncharacterized protein n=1 Tax=Penicillium nucicola TaxID=1850975 RepID=UPI002545B8AD
MPTIIGNSAPWKQVSEDRTSELHDGQQTCYQTAAIWARVTGEKTLDDSIHASVPTWKGESNWQIAYGSYVSPLASFSTEVIHHSVVSQNLTEPHPAIENASANYRKVAAATEADLVDSSGGDDAIGKSDKLNTRGNTNDDGFRPVASAKDFMSSFRALRLANATAAAAAAAAEPGPPRRLLFKNLPEWATISHVLHLVWGGAIERAWTEISGEVNVQFTDADNCNRYLELYPEGILIKDGDDVIQISIELMENDNEHRELASRVSTDASRLVYLSGLPTALMGHNAESILGIVSQPKWKNKELEQILIEYGADGNLDVHVLFFNLHDAWEFYHNIKDGTYECTPKFEADPCALANEFHFFDVRNEMFRAIVAANA